jgi:hypothetical protein
MINKKIFRSEGMALTNDELKLNFMAGKLRLSILTAQGTVQISIMPDYLIRLGCSVPVINSQEIQMVSL